MLKLTDVLLYLQLTFTVSFAHDCDVCYFAHCYPYGYSDLNIFLTEIQRRPNATEFVKISKLCSTLTGNKVPLLTITNFKCPGGTYSLMSEIRERAKR